MIPVYQDIAKRSGSGLRVDGDEDEAVSKESENEQLGRKCGDCEQLAKHCGQRRTTVVAEIGPRGERECYWMEGAGQTMD